LFIFINSWVCTVVVVSVVVVFFLPPFFSLSLVLSFMIIKMRFRFLGFLHSPTGFLNFGPFECPLKIWGCHGFLRSDALLFWAWSVCYVKGIGLFWFDCLVLGLLAEWRWCHRIPFVSLLSCCFCCLNCCAFCLVVISIILCRKAVFSLFSFIWLCIWILLIKEMLNMEIRCV